MLSDKDYESMNKVVKETWLGSGRFAMVCDSMRDDEFCGQYVRWVTCPIEAGWKAQAEEEFRTK